MKEIPARLSGNFFHMVSSLFPTGITKFGEVNA
jgi:hypothetical protein